MPSSGLTWQFCDGYRLDLVVLTAFLSRLPYFGYHYDKLRGVLSVSPQTTSVGRQLVSLLFVQLGLCVCLCAVI